MNPDEEPPKLFNLDDFTGDEISLLRYIWERGTFNYDAAAEDLGMKPEWLQHLVASMTEKGIPFTFYKGQTFRVFLRGGVLDGLEISMILDRQNEKIVFTLPIKLEVDEDLLTSQPEREFPGGMSQDMVVTVLIGKKMNEKTAAVYAYCTPGKHPDGMTLTYDRLVAMGTPEQMQLLLNAEKGRRA